MRVFLDFEASSLAKDSYPIEVGWAFEDGRSETWLIRPAPHWTDWDAAAQAIHGIPRSRLLAEGRPHGEVARRMLEVLRDERVYVTAPSWDGKWLSVLLRAAGLPRHALRFRDADEAHVEAARAVLSGAVPGDRLQGAVTAVLKQARLVVAGAPPAHRALADAERELQLWLEVGRLAEQQARAFSQS